MWGRHTRVWSPPTQPGAAGATWKCSCAPLQGPVSAPSRHPCGEGPGTHQPCMCSLAPVAGASPPCPACLVFSPLRSGHTQALFHLGEDSVLGTALQGLWAAGTFSSCTQTLSTSVCFPLSFPLNWLKAHGTATAAMLGRDSKDHRLADGETEALSLLSQTLERKNWGSRTGLPSPGLGTPSGVLCSCCLSSGVTQRPWTYSWDGFLPFLEPHR